VPSATAFVPGGQQTRVLVVGMDWGSQGQHMLRFWAGDVLTTKPQGRLQHTMGDAVAAALYCMQLLACDVGTCKSKAGNNTVQVNGGDMVMLLRHSHLDICICVTGAGTVSTLSDITHALHDANFAGCTLYRAHILTTQQQRACAHSGAVVKHPCTPGQCTTTSLYISCGMHAHH
jgi:hypothetical protein